VALLYKSLQKHGFSVGALHGDMDQSARTAALDQFRKGEIPLLVASDVAARGLDIPATSHVFNFDVPHHADDYVHRIGRTGRAGRAGTAISIVTPLDQKSMVAIEKLIGQTIPRIDSGVEPRTVDGAAAPSSGEPEASRHSRGREASRESTREGSHEGRKPRRERGPRRGGGGVALPSRRRLWLPSRRRFPLRPRARLRLGAPKRRRLPAIRLPSPPITRICRRSCCDLFAPGSDFTGAEISRRRSGRLARPPRLPVVHSPPLT